MKPIPIATVILFSLLLLPVLAQSKAELSGTTINIWSGSPAVQHEDNCTTLLADIPTKVMSCTSNFASTCISVHASINVTRGGATNWTNFSVNGCEIRMNMTSDGSSFITSWGNLTVINSNITTNNSNFESEINITGNSNFSMKNSFISEMGWASAANQRGLELGSPTYNFNNNTLTRNYNGITLNIGTAMTGASSSVLNNVTVSFNTNGIAVSAGSAGSKTNFTFTNINTSYNTGSGIYFRVTGNTLTNITAIDNSNGINIYSGGSNTITNLTASENTNGISLRGSSDNIFTDIMLIRNTDGIETIYEGITNNTFTNVTANSHGIAINFGQTGLARNFTFVNLNIWNCTTTASGCIYMSRAVNTTFIGGTVNLTQKYLVDIRNSNYTLFQDISFINFTQINGGINITSTNANTSSTENTFLNVTFLNVTEAVSGNSQLIRQWYADVYTSPAINGANITMRNSTQSLINYSYTNSTGWIQRLNLTAYINDSGSVSQWQPYNFSAFASGYVNVSDQYEALDASRVVAITLTPTCIPDCAGRECGPDPICGTSCGPCSGVCSNGLCCGNGVCSTNENCLADSSGCATQICRTASCTSGCVYTNILNGQEDPGYCDGPNQCDGNGGCIPDASGPPSPPGGGATPGFEPGLLIIFFSALLAGLLLPIASTRR